MCDRGLRADGHPGLCTDQLTIRPGGATPSHRMRPLRDMSGGGRRGFNPATIVLFAAVLLISPVVAPSAARAGISACVPVSGTVIDPYGNPLGGVTVTAADPSDFCSSAATATTSSAGAYTVDIPPGTSDTATASA